MLDRFKKSKPSDGNAHLVRPPVDIYETEKEIILEAEMPGVAKETLNVEVQGDNLAISGLKKKDGVEEKYTPMYQERLVPVEYHREFNLGSEVDRTKITAHYQNGTLKVVLAKSQEAQPQRIAITT